MKKMGISPVQNTVLALAGFFVLGTIAGLIPRADELLTNITNAASARSENLQPPADNMPSLGAAHAANAFECGWRYTKNGWQNRKNWQKPSPVEKPALDPVVVGSLQFLVCLAVLVAFSSQKTP